MNLRTATFVNSMTKRGQGFDRPRLHQILRGFEPSLDLSNLIQALEIDLDIEDLILWEINGP